MAKRIDDELSRIRWDVADVEGILQGWRILEERTGRSLQAWFDLMDAKAPKDPAGRIKYLMIHHRFTYYDAYVLVARQIGAFKASWSPGIRRRLHRGEVDEMFAGCRAALRPVMAKLVKTIRAAGDDVEVSPYRDHFSVTRVGLMAKVYVRSKHVNIAASASILRDERYGKPSQLARSQKLSRVDDVGKDVLAWLKKLRDYDAEVSGKKLKPGEEPPFFDVDEAFDLH